MAYLFSRFITPALMILRWLNCCLQLTLITYTYVTRKQRGIDLNHYETSHVITTKNTVCNTGAIVYVKQGFEQR